MKVSVKKMSMLALIAVCVGCNNTSLSLETSEMTIVSGSTQDLVVGLSSS